MTGGPDGDVAGNGIRILDREYGEIVQKLLASLMVLVLAKTPEGLTSQELLRLFKEGLSIANHSIQSKLGSKGMIASIEDSRRSSTSKHTLHNRLNVMPSFHVVVDLQPFTVATGKNI